MKQFVWFVCRQEAPRGSLEKDVLLQDMDIKMSVSHKNDGFI